jgi:hypothetical protein
MIDGKTFWWFVTAACLLWFSTITIYVAIRGGMDIKHMLRRLKATSDADRKE